jgi:hypothetical protein
MTKPVTSWIGAAAVAAVAAISTPVTRAEAATVSFVDGTFRAEAAGEVFVHFFTGTAGFTSELSGRVGDDPFTLIGTSNETPAGTGMSLGFANVGEEIAFRLFVRNTAHEFFSGPAGQNPDNIQHVAAADFAGGSINGSSPLPAGVLGGFEDLFGGGDRDFDDVRFLIRIASVPVPGPVAGAGIPALMALGGFVWARRRKAAAAV